MSKNTFKIIHENNQYKWESRSERNKINGSSGTFSRRIDCVANAERHGHNGNPSNIGKDDTTVISRVCNKYQWIRKSSNGRIVGSSKSYSRKDDCIKNAMLFGYVPEMESA